MGGGSGVGVMVASWRSARPARAGGVDVEQLQQLGLQRRWRGDGGRVVATGGVEAQPGQRLEDQPAGRLGLAAGVQPRALYGGGDGMALRASGQAYGQQRQA